MRNNKKNDPVVFVYDRVEDDDAILVRGESILKINKKFLPESAQLGEKIVLTLIKESEYGKQSEKRGKELINEILASN